MTREVRMSLPWPPTVNTYRVPMVMGKGTRQIVRLVLSAEARKYRERAHDAMLSQGIRRGVVHGRLRIEITACAPDRRDRDLDNLPKGILDALKHSGVIRDDADIDDLRITRGPVRKGGCVEITLAEIPGEPTESGELFANGAAA